MTSRRTYSHYLRDILEHAEKAERFTASVDFEGFCANEEKVLAVIRTLEVIGEAARHVSDPLRQRYPDVPWRQMAGMRDVLIHGYFGVNPLVVWKTVKDDVPPMRQAVARMLIDLDQVP